MFDELAERSLMSPLAGTKHTYVRLAIIIHCQIFAFFQKIYFNQKCLLQQQVDKYKTYTDCDILISFPKDSTIFLNKVFKTSYLHGGRKLKFS